MSSSAPVNGTADATAFPAPNGTQAVMDTGYQLHAYPVLLWSDYIYWPLSYVENNFSMIIMQTDEKIDILREIPAPGARYISWIDVNFDTQTVSFYGQGGEYTSLPWSVLLVAPSSPTSHTGVIAGATVGGIVGLVLAFIGWKNRAKIANWFNRPRYSAVDRRRNSTQNALNNIVVINNGLDYSGENKPTTNISTGNGKQINNNGRGTQFAAETQRWAT